MTAVPLALVTGGTHRLGAAIAARLARAGYALALHQRAAAAVDPALAETLADTQCDWAPFVADLADADAVAALIPAVTAHFGRPPSLLVNNAALFAESGWQDIAASDLTAMMQVNHHAPVLLATALVRAQDDGAQAAIVNIVDQRVANPVPDQLAYSMAKAALWQSTRVLAVAFGAHARVNAVAPGLTLPTADYSAAQMERLAATMPLARLPDPAAIADAVLYLARAEATTGQTLFVDGGANLAAQGRDFVHLERD